MKMYLYKGNDGSYIAFDEKQEVNENDILWMNKSVFTGLISYTLSKEIDIDIENEVTGDDYYDTSST